MKVNISFLPESLNEYTNFSILANQNNVQMAHIDVGECEEILALNVIESLPRQMTEAVLKDWTSKLAHKGRFIVSFTDCYTVSRLFFLQQLSVQDFNVLMHGNMANGWDEKKQNFTIPQFCQILESMGLKILKKKLDGVNAIVEAERP